MLCNQTYFFSFLLFGVCIKFIKRRPEVARSDEQSELQSHLVEQGCKVPDNYRQEFYGYAFSQFPASYVPMTETSPITEQHSFHDAINKRF